MSMHYRLRKSIKAEELSTAVSKRSASARTLGRKGRLDRYPPYMKVKEVRYLTDGKPQHGGGRL